MSPKFVMNLANRSHFQEGEGRGDAMLLPVAIRLSGDGCLQGGHRQICLYLISWKKKAPQMLNMPNHPFSQFPLYFAPPHPYLYFYYPPPPIFPDLSAKISNPDSQAPSFTSPNGQLNEWVNNQALKQQVDRKWTHYEQNHCKDEFRMEERKPLRKNHFRKGQNIQLQHRNILPNTVNVVLSYVRRANKSKKNVERILKALGRSDVQQTTKKFYAYQNFLKNNATDFINRQAIQALMVHEDPHCCFFSSEEQLFFNKVFRMLVRCYLRQNYLPSLLSSRLSPCKRKDHLKVFRHLESILFSMASSSSRLEDNCQ